MAGYDRKPRKDLANWTPFWWDSKQWRGVVATLDDWTALVRRFMELHNVDKVGHVEPDLLQRGRRYGGHTPNGPEYGLRLEHTGPKLATFFDEHGMVSLTGRKAIELARDKLAALKARARMHRVEVYRRPVEAGLPAFSTVDLTTLDPETQAKVMAHAMTRHGLVPKAKA